MFERVGASLGEHSKRTPSDADKSMTAPTAG